MHHRRLTSAERKALSSGSVFVFDEQDSGIRRWTDGRLWSPSRITVRYYCFNDLIIGEFLGVS